MKNFEHGEASGLLYSRTEGHRALIHVRLRRGELDEAERLCDAAMEFVSGTDSRVSHLWLGPLHIEVLLAKGKRAEAEEQLASYQELVNACHSPRFSREAERLAKLLKQN